MKRLSVIFLLCITTALTAFGQSFFEKLDLGIDKLKYSKLDTNYIAPPDYKLMIAVGSKNFWGRDNVHLPFSWNDPDIYDYCPGIEKYEKEKILAHSNQSSLNFRVSYKGFSASYGFALNGSGNKKSFSLGSQGNAFGFNIGFERNSLSNAKFHDYRYLPIAYGLINEIYELGGIDRHFTIDEIAQYSVYHKQDLIDDELLGENDEWELDEISHYYANFYYAFNHRKFSMSAANYAQYIQKRSAGSFFVTADVNYTRMKANNLFFIDDPDIAPDTTYCEKFKSFAVALGAGYGYNWTPNHGKFLLHGSIRPTVNVYSRMDYDNRYTTTDATGKKISGKTPREDELYPLYDHKMKLTFGGVARVAAVWNISPRFVVGTNLEYTIRDNRNSKDYRMYNSRLNFNAYAAMRFLKTKK